VVNTSGTKLYNLPIDELIREATERVGGKWDSAEEMDSAIRSLNLVTQDLFNRGKPLFALKLKTTEVVTSVRDYTLSAGIGQVVGMTLRVSAGGSSSQGPTDFPLNRIGFIDYNNISSKQTTGQPTLYTVQQQRDDILVKIWPTPTSLASDPGYQLRYFAVEYPDTVTRLYQDPDFSRRYYPVLCDGLAYYMALKRPDVPMERIAMFKQRFEESVIVAFGEDREQVSHIVRPITYWYN